MTQGFGPLMAAIVALELEVADAAERAKPDDRPRVYEWRPSGAPELPAIWNWIDDGSYDIVDTGRGDDLLVVTCSIGVKPSDSTEAMGQLARLTDVFREVVDPSLNGPQPLGGACRYAKRVITRTAGDEFNGVPVLCMDLLVRCELTAFIGEKGG